MKIIKSFPALLLAGLAFCGCATPAPAKVEEAPPAFVLYEGIDKALDGREDIIKSFQSRILNNKRNIRVYLPKGYGESQETYPVLYMHDGQNIFAPGGPYGCWKIDTTVDALTDAGTIVPVIVVGIDNTGNREREYNVGNGGIVEDYAQFVITEVMPFVNAQYRTKTGPSNTAVMGSSYGGNASLYFAWYHSDVFGMSGCVSSALWWDNMKFFSAVLDSTAPKKPVKFWIDAGDSEDQDPEGDGVDYFGEIAYRLANTLLYQGWKYTEDLLYEVAHEAGHNEAAWAARVHKPLQFFFGKDTKFVPVSLVSRPSVSEMDLAGSVPRAFLFSRVEYSNGIVADVPPSLLTVTGNHEDWYSLEYGILTLKPGAAKAGEKLNLAISGLGLVSTCPISIVSALSNASSLSVSVTAPLNSPDAIYLVGDFSGWTFPRAVILTLDRTTADAKVFKADMPVKRGQNLTFKFCSGPDWKFEEFDGSGKPTNNRTVKIGSDANQYTGTVREWKAVP